jgi:sensor histidine kinase YesM
MNLSGQQNRLENFSMVDGLPSLAINDILQDEIGYLWLASNKGLVRFDGNEFKSFTTKNSATINTLFFKDNLLYIGSKKGLCVKRNNEITCFGNENILKIIAIKGAVFLGTTQGVFELREDYLAPLKINTLLDFSMIHDLIVNKESIYIASNKGLWKLKSLKKGSKPEKIMEGTITSLLVQNKKILATTSNNGIKIIKNDSISSTIYTAKGSQKSTRIDTEIWLSTLEHGIEIYNADNFSFQRKINKYNTLETNNIQTVFKDNQDHIWIGTSDKGIYKIQKETLDSNKIKPTLYLEKFAVNYKNIDSIDINNYTKKITLKPSQNNVSIVFKTVDLEAPNNVQYRYKIADKFSPWSANNSIEFGNLNPGNYTFSVQSRNQYLLESTLKNFSFYIDIPLYKKPWFLIGLISLFFLILSVFVEFYIRSIRNKNQQKIEELEREKHLLSLEQKALQLQMNPHFIFNVLNGIKGLGNLGKTQELNKAISQFSVLLRSVLNNARLEEISLQEEIESLKNYLDLEQQMSSKSFTYSIEKNLDTTDAEEILIPPMLLQPLVENAIEHGIQANATNGKIRIEFKIQHPFLECSIIDNGIGIHHFKDKDNENGNDKGNDKEHASVALSITKERIINLSNKNSFSIDEIQQRTTTNGTKVWFKIPFKTDY